MSMYGTGNENGGNHHHDDGGNPRYAAVSAAVWTVILVVYLLISFFFKAWRYTWIIFIIGAAVQSVLHASLNTKQ